MRSIVSKLRLVLARELRGRILDCGCGEDLFGPYFRSQSDEVISLDLDEKTLMKIPGTRVVASCAQMPFPDDYFDAVWVCAVIEHVREDSLPEMIRVTRVGGRVIAVTPNHHSPWDQLKRILGLKTWWDSKGHVRLFHTSELRFFGAVHGETRFIPCMGWFFWNRPEAAHTLILDIDVTQELKDRVRLRFPDSFERKTADAVRVLY